MSRKEMIKHLRGFRDAWESMTSRNQDMSDERLKEESDEALRDWLKYWFSNQNIFKSGFIYYTIFVKERNDYIIPFLAYLLPLYNFFLINKLKNISNN